jgi:septum formation protein
MIPILLASTSPRRIDLLRQSGLTVEVVTPHADETPQRGEKPAALVRRLSRMKALSVLEAALAQYPHCLILGADTIVVAPGSQKILGKPVDPVDARRMLRLIAGREHTVLTGYTWVEAKAGEEKPRSHTRVVSTRVRMRALTPAMIAQYVATGEPLDKAGSYAAQGLGGTLVESNRGSYTNVVGLPVTQVLGDLEKVFKIPLFSWRT